MAFYNQLKEVEEMMEFNGITFSDAMNLTPFDFMLLRRIFIQKMDERNKNNH